MNESTTATAAPASAPRQDPPKWVKFLVGIGLVVVFFWMVGSCAEGMSDGYNDHVGQRGSTAPVAGEVSNAGPVDTGVLAFQMALDAQGVPMARSPQMVTAGRSACEALDAGASVEQLALVAYRSANEGAGFQMLTLHQAGYIVGASVSSFCPQHRDLIR